jgi:hypothetical protein
VDFFLLFDSALLEGSLSASGSGAGASAIFAAFLTFLTFGAVLVVDLRSFHIAGVASLAPATSFPLITLTSTLVGSAFLGASSTCCYGYSYSFSFTSSSTLG